MKNDVAAVVWSMCMLSFTCTAAVDTNLQIQVRHVLEDVVRNVSPLLLPTEGIVDDFEIGGRWRNKGIPSNEFRPVVELMSNNWQRVLADINLYATNACERMILENTGWFLPEGIYLGYLSALTNKVQEGDLPRVELRAFLLYSMMNHRVSSALFRKCREPKIVELVNRIQRTGIETNMCQRILTGEALRRYEYSLGRQLIE